MDVHNKLGGGSSLDRGDEATGGYKLLDFSLAIGELATCLLYNFPSLPSSLWYIDHELDCRGALEHPLNTTLYS